MPITATATATAPSPVADAAHLFHSLGSGWGSGAGPAGPARRRVTPSAVADRSPSARRVALAAPPGAQSRPASARPGRLGLEIIVDIAVGLAAAEGLWRPHVSHDPVSRTSVRLVSTPAYEVWLLGWTPGQRVELHDHGGADAAFVVVDGELDELTLGGPADGPRHLGRRHLRAGEVGTVASGAVHDVVNRSTLVATSLHVYADPLRTMTFYDQHGTPTFTEIVQEVPAILSSATTASALHPSRAR